MMRQAALWRGARAVLHYRGMAMAVTNENASINKNLRIFSGIQPTGFPTLGNFIGSLANWVKLQDQAEQALFSIVNLHSITVFQSPEILRENSIDMAISFLAAGIDPKKSIVFLQSQVSQHAQLCWLLCCVTPFGMLSRMTQWKDKSEQRGRKLLGLYSYPVLQAADILLYNATSVPVGEDQRQHIELARDIAQYFNALYGANQLVMPEPIFSQGKRVMSLRDPSKKMSKSDPNDNSRINLTDTPDTIRAKIAKAVTDSEEGITYDRVARPAVANLVDLYAAVAEIDPEDVVRLCQGITQKATFKTMLADLIIERLTPIQSEIARLREDRGYVLEVLEDGRERALSIAVPNYHRLERLVGLA